MGKRGRKSKDTPELRKIIEKALIETRSHKTAYQSAKISPQTYFRWIRDNRDFSEFITRAMEKFDKLDVRNRLDLKEKAIDSLEQLLTPREIISQRSYIYTTRDANGNIIGTKERKEIRKVVRDPNFYAIEKVLGKRELEYLILNKALLEGKEQRDAPLFQQIFGKYGSALKEENWGDNIFSESIDLLRIRYLQAETQRQFENGLISFDEYNRMVTEQSKAYVFIKDNLESRATNLIKGYTPEEIIMQIKRFVFMVIKTIEEVVNDVNVDRKDIPSELARKIKANSELSSKY